MNFSNFFQQFKTPIESFHWHILKYARDNLFKENDGEYILDKKWDNLIILDACRFDYFKEIYEKQNIKGTLYRIISRGTHTTEFLTENFPKDYYDDIVYLTPTPFVDMHCKNKFYKTISVWKESWDNKHLTVLPETMYNHAIDAMIKYPNKRLIIHFMQPHYPYISNNSKNLRNHVRTTMKKSFRKDKSLYFGKGKFNRSFFSYYSNRLYALFNKKIHIKVFKDNLNYVVFYVKKLIEILPGTTVVSSDHGEAFGEFLHPLLPVKYYGHDTKIRIFSLTHVPWLVIKPEEKNNKIFKKDIKEKEKLIRNINKKKII